MRRNLDNLRIMAGKLGSGGYGFQIKVKGEEEENFFCDQTNGFPLQYKDEIHFSVADEHALLLADALEIAARQIRDSYNKNWMLDYLYKHGDVVVDKARSRRSQVNKSRE